MIQKYKSGREIVSFFIWFGIAPAETDFERLLLLSLKNYLLPETDVLSSR